LLDGLDEVRERPLEVIRALESFIQRWDAPGNRFLATSRIAGYEDAPLSEQWFNRATVRPFDDDDIRAFTLNWSRAYERVVAAVTGAAADSQAAATERAAQARAASLEQSIFARENITDLARNPLLLTILALIHQKGSRLPDRHIELYRLCVEALAETWNTARSITYREIEIYLGPNKLDEAFVVQLLGPAALWVQSENPGGLVEFADLRTNISATLIHGDGLAPARAARLAGEFVELVRRHTGLLQERGYCRYGFLHLTFEEYLAARALNGALPQVIGDADAILRQRACDPGWREVIRLLLATATPREALRLLRLLLATPAAGDDEGRPVILAGDCLLDMRPQDIPGVGRAEVVAALLALIDEGRGVAALRVEAAHTLARLDDPRPIFPERPGFWCDLPRTTFWFGDDRKGELRQVELAYDFRISRYPVTNALFARFLEAQGGVYDPAADWWTPEGRTFLAPGGHRWDNQDEPITLPRYWHDVRYNSNTQPVVGVSWYEAAAFCNWLAAVGHAQGWLPAGQVIRLPTAREWERAARGEDKRRYPWGDAPPTPERANYDKTGIRAPAPAGCFPLGRAACGAEDMAGNVIEWLATPDGRDGQLVADLLIC
jgi:hypothetical protein